MAFWVELEAPAALHKGKGDSRSGELEIGGVKCEFGEEENIETNRKSLELEGEDAAN